MHTYVRKLFNCLSKADQGSYLNPRGDSALFVAGRQPIGSIFPSFSFSTSFTSFSSLTSPSYSSCSSSCRGSSISSRAKRPKRRMNGHGGEREATLASLRRAPCLFKAALPRIFSFSFLDSPVAFHSPPFPAADDKEPQWNAGQLFPSPAKTRRNRRRKEQTQTGEKLFLARTKTQPELYSVNLSTGFDSSLLLLLRNTAPTRLNLVIVSIQSAHQRVDSSVFSNLPNLKMAALMEREALLHLFRITSPVARKSLTFDMKIGSRKQKMKGTGASL